MHIVIVTGGRVYKNRERLYRALDVTHQVDFINLLIEGGADGADCMARQWAAARKVPSCVFHARWNEHGSRAGPERNLKMADFGKWMMDAGAEVEVFAFLGGTGTANMMQVAQNRGLRVVPIKEDDSA